MRMLEQSPMPYIIQMIDSSDELTSFNMRFESINRPIQRGDTMRSTSNHLKECIIFTIDFCLDQDIYKFHLKHPIRFIRRTNF